MRIQLEVLNVGAPQTVPTKNGKSYNVIEVAYKKDGKVEGKKILSFASPDVYKAVQKWRAGEVVTVETEKNEQGYWQWVAVVDTNQLQSPTPNSPSPQAATGGKVTGSNYETKEERAKRQEYIIRQSSLGHAIELLASNGGKKNTVEEVIQIAEQFFQYVTSQRIQQPNESSIEEWADDIPQ